MMRTQFFWLSLAGLLLTSSIATPANAQAPNCERISKLTLPNTTVSSAQFVDAAQLRTQVLPVRSLRNSPVFAALRPS